MIHILEWIWRFGNWTVEIMEDILDSEVRVELPSPVLVAVLVAVLVSAKEEWNDPMRAILLSGQYHRPARRNFPPSIWAICYKSNIEFAFRWYLAISCSAPRVSNSLSAFSVAKSLHRALYLRLHVQSRPGTVAGEK
jgi:hypothetical protein